MIQGQTDNNRIYTYFNNCASSLNMLDYCIVWLLNRFQIDRVMSNIFERLAKIQNDNRSTELANECQQKNWFPFTINSISSAVGWCLVFACIEWTLNSSDCLSTVHIDGLVLSALFAWSFSVQVSIFFLRYQQPVQKCSFIKRVARCYSTHSKWFDMNGSGLCACRIFNFICVI